MIAARFDASSATIRVTDDYDIRVARPVKNQAGTGAE